MKILERVANEEVQWKRLGEILNYEQPNKYIVSSKEYDNKYKIPVLTAGQSFILGYTNEENGVFEASKENPVIIFDDFTTSNHWVDFRFKVKSSAMKFLRLKKENMDKINFKYCYYCMQIIEFDATEHKRKWISEYSELEIPIPSLETQEEIVEILDTFTSYIDEITKECNLREKQYNYYCDMMLSLEYLKKISNKFYPNGDFEIVEKKLGDIATVSRGASPRPISSYLTEEDNGVAWIKIGDIEKSSKYVTSTKEKITQEGAKKSRVLKKGDFILSNSMSYGRPYILGIDGAIHDGWASISEFEKNINSDFLYYTLTSDKVQRYWESKINGSSIKNLNSDIINSLKITLPPLAVQKHVVDILDKFYTISNDLKEGLPYEIELRQKQYEYYREKLLDFKK